MSQEAYRQAIRMLSRRALTRGELLRRLREKGFGVPAAREACERAAGMGYLDDLRIASRLAERLLLEKGYGKRRAVQEMKRRLLEEESIRLALADLEGSNPEAEQEAIRRSRQRWVARHGEPEDDASRGRLANHLKGRGFPDALIRRQVLDRGARR